MENRVLLEVRNQARFRSTAAELTEFFESGQWKAFEEKLTAMIEDERGKLESAEGHAVPRAQGAIEALRKVKMLPEHMVKAVAQRERQIHDSRK